MKISKGVEWAVHACLLMAALPSKHGLKAEALALYHGVPATYMAKQLQALSKDNIVHSSRGARGGYRLAKPPAEISLWDVVCAIEGKSAAFRCTEIRQNGPCGLSSEYCKNPCSIAAAFLGAENAFRRHLSRISIADVATQTIKEAAPDHMQDIFVWLSKESVDLGQN